MALHPVFQEALREGSFILLYGKPGVGKTTLALELARGALSLGLDVCIIATEAGSTLALRHASLGGSLGVYEVLGGIIDVALAVMECVRGGRFTVVDSVNAPYRVEGGGIQAGRPLSLASALLRWSAERGVGGAATAQVSLSGEEVPGWEHVAPWATHIAKLEREGATTRVELAKPRRLLLEFTVAEGGVTWM